MQPWYRQARIAQRRLCEFALEFGLPHLMEEPGCDSEVYFGELCNYQPLQSRCYAHKHKWAELFYAISLLLQGKQSSGAQLLEQLLLSLPPGTHSWPNWAGKSVRRLLAGAAHLPAALRVSGRNRRWENALLQLVSIQLLEDLQESQVADDAAITELAASPGQGHIAIDHRLLDLRRTEIQQVYPLPQLWFAYFAKEQNHNIAIVMIRELVRTAYERQLRPIHLAALRAQQNKPTKHSP